MAKTIPDRIADLEALSTPDLRLQWEHAFGRPAPKRTSRDLLLRDYCGTRYTSLSRIARAITGTRWSGPLFFGLRKPGPRYNGAIHGR